YIAPPTSTHVSFAAGERIAQPGRCLSRRLPLCRGYRNRGTVLCNLQTLATQYLGLFLSSEAPRIDWSDSARTAVRHACPYTTTGRQNRQVTLAALTDPIAQRTSRAGDAAAHAEPRRLGHLDNSPDSPDTTR